MKAPRRAKNAPNPRKYRARPMVVLPLREQPLDAATERVARTLDSTRVALRQVPPLRPGGPDNAPRFRHTAAAAMRPRPKTHRRPSPATRLGTFRRAVRPPGSSIRTWSAPNC
jgi:hypothetical protein